jgi:hypothetical protein
MGKITLRGYGFTQAARLHARQSPTIKTLRREPMLHPSLLSISLSLYSLIPSDNLYSLIPSDRSPYSNPRSLQVTCGATQSEKRRGIRSHSRCSRKDQPGLCFANVLLRLLTLTDRDRNFNVQPPGFSFHKVLSRFFLAEKESSR